MSWKFGPFTVSTRDVVSVDTINESFLSIIEEVTGELNEHNFAEDAFDGTTSGGQARADLAEDIGIRLHHTKQEADPNAVPAATAATPTNIPVSTRWTELESSFNKTVVTKGGSLWIIASFQLGGSNGAGLASEYGALFSIEFDGVILGDSLLGSGDIDNDSMAATSLATATFVFGPTPAIFFTNAGAVVIEAVVKVGPGTYLIRPVFRNPKIGDLQEQHISNRELIIVEQR